MENYPDLVREHYDLIWKNTPRIFLWDKGPIENMNYDFRVLEYPPTKIRQMWTYATVGMSSDLKDNRPIEVHLFSSKQDDGLIELLTTLAYYHKNKNSLGLNHTVYFGRSWQDKSLCNHGLISLPYIDGPKLENLPLNERDLTIKCYWLIPITEKEVIFKKRYGVNALEEKFDSNGLDYLNPNRLSIIK